MTRTQIDNLLLNIRSSGFPDACLIETHISWVILEGENAYKIKKEIHLHFLDFSTVEKRKYFCEKEITLNRRLTDDIYLAVLPVRIWQDNLFIGQEKGSIVDYAVHMRRMDDDRRMDILLNKQAVSEAHIDRLAARIAAFHTQTDIITKKDPADIPGKFADLASEIDYLKTAIPADPGIRIVEAVCISDRFCLAHRNRIEERIGKGFTRDCHGDLHTRNIFLLQTPQAFDCIEFNNDIRQIDVLNEIAFLCMDLDAFGRTDLSEQFLSAYCAYFPAIGTDEDRLLFVYYKSYRANIRAKVNSMRSRSATTYAGKKEALAETSRYLSLMHSYLEQLK